MTSRNDRRSFSRLEASLVATALLLCGAVLLAWREPAGWLLILLAAFTGATQLQTPSLPIGVVACPPPREVAPLPDISTLRSIVEPEGPPPMLTEVPHTRQIAHEAPRRWFSSVNMDLIVWLDTGSQIKGFQLCYDKLRAEKALEWRRDQGYRHMNVDDGEARPRHYKRAPILVPDGYFDARRVAQLFDEQSLLLPRYLFEFVAGHLAAHPNFDSPAPA